MRSSSFAMPAVRPSVLGFTTALMLAGVPAFMLSGAAAELKLAGDWEVLVLLKKPHPLAATVHVASPEIVTVVAEKYDSLPPFNPNAGGWGKGAQLCGVRAQETTTPYLLDPESLVLRAGPEPDAALLRRGEDYEADLTWGTIGRSPHSALKETQPVFASYG